MVVARISENAENKYSTVVIINNGPKILMTRRKMDDEEGLSKIGKRVIFTVVQFAYRNHKRFEVLDRNKVTIDSGRTPPNGRYLTRI